MARPRKIHVDRAALLAGIKREWAAEHEHLTRKLSGAERMNHSATARDRVELDYLTGLGIVSDVRRFIGSPLTATMQLYYQRELRQCEVEGLVSIDGDRARRVLLTEAGEAWLTLEAAKGAAQCEPVASPVVDPMAHAQE